MNEYDFFRLNENQEKTEHYVMKPEQSCLEMNGTNIIKSGSAIQRLIPSSIVSILLHKK